MLATCKECSNTWELQKDPADYKDGPRCTDCGSRVVDIEEVTPEPTASEATAVFQALDDDCSPMEVVRDGICSDPGRVEQLVEQFERLSDVHVISSAELRSRREEAYAEGAKEARSNMRQQLKRKTQQVEYLESQIEELKHELSAIQSRLHAEYADGWNKGQAALREELEDEFNARFEERLSEIESEHDQRQSRQCEEHETRLADQRDEYETQLENVQDEFEDKLEAERQRAEAEYTRGYEQAIEDIEDDRVGKIYAAGVDDGVFTGMVEGIEEGKTEGFVLAAEAVL